MAKKCKKKKKTDNKSLSEVKKYECKGCGLKANKEKKLCKPQKVDQKLVKH
jgi:hypothetical protein